MNGAASARRSGLPFVILVATLAVVARLVANAPAYGDLAWQIPEGLSILSGHIPATVPYAIEANGWLDHEWLFEAYAAFWYAHGLYAVFALSCLFAFACFPAFLYARLRESCSDAAATLVALLATAGIFFTSPFRPQTFALYLFTLVLFEVRAARPNPWRTLAYVVLWANLHASVVLAPVLGVLHLLGAWKERAAADRLRALGWTTLAATLGTLATPFGIRLWLYAAQFTDAPFAQYIREWRPLDFSQPEALDVFLPALALFVASGLRAERANTTNLLLVTPFFILAAEHVRHVAFLVPAIAPVLAAQLDAWGPFWYVRSALSRYERPARLIAVIPFAVAVALGSAIPHMTFTPQPPGLPSDVVTLARGTNASGNAYVARPFAAYLPFAGVANVRLLIDSHADPYPLDVWSDVHELETLGPGWRDVLARRKLDAIITDRESPLAIAMALLPGWRTAAAAGDAIAFVRR